MSIEIVKKACENARNGKINLGTINGWGEETNALYKALKEYIVPNSGSSENLGRCYNAYEFDILFEEQTYRVRYSVDSGD